MGAALSSESSTRIRERLEADAGALREQLANDRALAQYETLGAHVADAVSGGVVFWAGLAVAQVAQRAAGVGAATPVVPRFVGTLAVAGSSALAVQLASLPREVAEGPLTAAAIAAAARRRLEDLAHAPFPAFMAMGVACFLMLGGRMAAVAPSHYANLGAFHLRRASLPATAEYATATEREVIQHFGRLFGCHTCGARRGVAYNADHMPPKLVAKRRNAGLLRRLTGREVTFRFYPQCAPCSNAQGTVVRLGRNDVRLHLSALRLYHATGFWLVLLCTGGLYAGGSTFHEHADVPTPTNNCSTSATAPDSADRALLRELREREKRIKGLRRAARGDPAVEAALDVELRSIDECKAHVKAHTRQLKGE